MNMKFELIPSDTIEVDGVTLRRIRALRDIPEFNVKIGDLGGYLEKEANLSVQGTCWVSDKAQVSGGARVSPMLISGLQWLVTITDHYMRIGCQFHEIEAWDKFTDAEIAEMDGKYALRFWRESKEALMILARNHAKKATAEKASK